MTKKMKNIFIVAGIILIIMPLLCYYVKFHNQPLADKTETWGQFGDYLNGTFMPLIALIGVVVTLLLGLISDKRNETNIQLEQLKQRPLLHLGYRDAETEIRVCMKNKGNGPLLIEKYQVLDTTDNDRDIGGLYFGLPSLFNNYDNYTGNQNNTVLSPGEEVELLAFKYDEDKAENKYEKDLASIREVLKKYNIVVEYKDVYNNKMPKYERNLSWFGRHEIKTKEKSK